MKINIHRSIVIVYVLVIFMACNKNSTEPSIELNPLLKEEMIRNLSLEPGIRTDSLDLSAGIVWNYSISVTLTNQRHHLIQRNYYG